MNFFYLIKRIEYVAEQIIILQTSPKKIESVNFVFEDSEVNRGQKSNARRNLAFEYADKNNPDEKRTDCKRPNDQLIESNTPAKRFKSE